MADSSRIKILVNNTAWIYFSKIFTQLISLITTILVIRKLAVDIFGTYNFLLNTFVIIELFVLSSITSVFNRYIPELIKNNEFYKLKKLINTGLLISIPSLIVSVVLIIIFEKPFGEFFNIPDFSQYLIPFLIYIICAYFKALIDNILRSFLLHKLTSKITMFNSFLRSVLFFAFLSILNVNILMYIESFLCFLFAVQGFRMFYQHFRKNQDPSIETTNPVTQKRVIRYGLYSSINELGAGIVGKTSDYYIISSISNTYLLGLYSFAYRLYGLIYQLLPLRDFLTVLRPLFIQKYTSNYNKEEYINMYNFIIKVMLPIFLLPGIYFFLFGKPFIIYLFDIKYIDAYWVTCIILFSHWVTAFFYPLGLTIILKEKMHIALFSKIVVIFSILGGIWAMKLYGIIGVALITMIGDFLRNFIMYIWMKKYDDVEYRLSEFLKYFYQIIILAGIFYIFNHYNYINTPFKFIVFSALFVIVAFFLAIKLHPFNSIDLQLLKEITAKNKYLVKASNVIIKIYQFKLF